MNVTITPHTLCGEVTAPPSKSQAHRALICAALCGDTTEIFCPQTCDDIDATTRCLCAMGAEIQNRESSFIVRGISAHRCAALDCGESASTLRFLLPLVCALGIPAEFKLHGSLPTRPMEPLLTLLRQNGVQITQPSPDTLCVSGKLQGQSFQIAADVSSQFISGLLLALPLLGGGTVRLVGGPESVSYVRMTIQVMESFGVHALWNDDTITVSGSYKTPGYFNVEGDWSAGAFWLAAGPAVHCRNLDTSLQGDSIAPQLMQEICRGSAVIDARQIPDLVPILSVYAALHPGTTRIENIGRLRLKESDRAAAIVDLLAALGGQAICKENTLVIEGQPTLRGGTVSGFGDHRIVMSAAIASIGCREPVTICGAEAVQKSYPRFWEDFESLGGLVKWEDACD